MAPSDWELFYGKGAKRPQCPAEQPQPVAQSMSFVDAYKTKKSYGPNAILPPDMHGYSLEDLRLRAEEEQRPAVEAREREAGEKRVAQASTAVRRAMEANPKRPKRIGWRLRVSFLDNLKRGRSVAEAAARTGIDETTARRWRRKFPAFDKRWTEIVESRGRQERDDLTLRAGEPIVTRRYFFRGKQVGELTRHDDRALMFLIKLSETARQREEDRAERREIRAHDLRMRELEIDARRETHGGKNDFREKPGFSGQAASAEKT